MELFKTLLSLINQILDLIIRGQVLDMTLHLYEKGRNICFTLYNCGRRQRQAKQKVDRNILQRRITAYRAGRVNLNKIMQHELMSVSLSLATTSGILYSANKVLLADVLTQDVTTPTTVSLDGPICLLIGQALVMHGSCQTPKYQNFCQYYVHDGGHLHED